uniref:DUF4592 domain-containing protein n=1 Tax=Leptobrachium leishanense TaxID=445787 RepID=A0A8C5PJE0_9ANUR
MHFNHMLTLAYIAARRLRSFTSSLLDFHPKKSQSSHCSGTSFFFGMQKNTLTSSAKKATLKNMKFASWRSRIRGESIMAAASSDGPHASETEEVHDENSGKKKSKFQAFKKFFVKKKRKECPTPSKETSLKPSQSSGDVSVSADSMAAVQPAGDPGTKSHMGNKALSHDSVFMSEPENIKDCSSQENLPGKVKSLQLQLEQNMRIGSPPRGIIAKNVEDSGALSEDDGLPRSPPEIGCLHELLADPASKGSSRPLSPFPSAPSCPTSPTSHSILVDFTAPANSQLCLDNSAAKHKIAVKPKNQRGPAGRPKQNASEQPKESGVTHTANAITEPELDSESAKSTEDVDKTLPVVDVKPVPELPEPEVGQNTCEDDGVLFVPMTLEFNDVETKDRQVPSREEDVKGGDDVDLCSSAEPKGDDIGYPIGAAVKNKENPPLSDHIVNSSLLQEDVRTDLVELPRSVHMESGATVCDVKECNITGSSENVSLTEVIESISCVSEGEEPSPQEQLVTTSSEIRSESTENIGRTLVIDETPLLDGDVFDLQSSVVPCSRAKPTEDEDASGTITSSEVSGIPGTIECAESIVCDHRPSDHLSTVESLNTHGPTDLESTSDAGQIHHGIAEGCKAHEVHVLINSVMEIRTDESCPALVPNGAVGKQLDVLPNTDPLTNTCDEIKPTEINTESKPKSIAKPVRFTVAPAWQRSFSIKGNVLKSGSFDEETVVTLKDASRNTETAKKGDELIVPFGIRLRSTSTPVKYSEDPFGDSVTACPVDSLSVDLNPNSLMLTPTSQVPLDDSKASENPTPLKVKVDDPSPRDSAGPNWISMAKQKRKGFQEHLRVREPGVSAEKSPTQSSLKANTDSSPHIAEAKPKTALSSDVPAAPREIQPVTEQSKSLTPSQKPDEPPWMSLAKKKAKAWSEMPHIAQ